MAKADFSKAKELFPSTQMNEAQWLTVFDSNPDIMWHIIGDIYDIVKAEEEKERGIRSMGRRPARKSVSLEKLYATVFPPTYSNDPFPEALKSLIVGKSQRQFAMKVPCNQSTLSRMLSGQIDPDLVMLERVAAAAKVSPHYFMEWRAQYLGQLITRILLERPHMSITALRSVRHGRRSLGEVRDAR